MVRLFSILFVFVALGCSQRSAVLQNSVEQYVKAIRRGDAQVAISYVHPDKRDQFAQTMDRLDKDLLISQVELKSIVPDEKFENAVVTLLLEYFDQRSSMVMMSRPVSMWKYDEAKKVWLLDSSTSWGEVPH